MKRIAGWLAICVTLLSFMSASVLADSKPYFKVYGGDVFAGGEYDTGATNCATADAGYQAPTYAPLTNQYSGGILAFATSTRAGASTDFGAFAMGLIEGNSTNQYGFFTGPSGTSTLSFANSQGAVSSNYWGGYLAGATAQVHCIPDYYGTKQNSPANIGTASTVDLSALASKQYIVTPTGASVNLSAAATSIANGKDITIFVNGNAYIGNNITYASGYTSDNVPKLAIVVRGQIYIDPSVTEIDGLYIAQPNNGAGGQIWTCHDATNTEPDGFWVRSNCGGASGNCANKLTVGGALIAQEVLFLRTNGDLASASANEPGSSCNIGEVINYTPAMVLGGGFFNPPASQNPNIDSLISLPPVF